MRLRPAILLLAALAWLVVPTLVMAQEDITPPVDEHGDCATDDDCAEGSYCLQVEESSCAMPPPCEPEDLDCLSDPSGSECETVLVGICMPDWLVECASDSDCGPNLICITFEDTLCMGGGDAPCDDAGNCPEPSPPEECTVESYSFCLPAYLSPCVENADCGEGFECRLEESCWCDGGDPTGPDGGDPTGPDGGGGNEPACECVIGDTGWCEVIVSPCESDAECAEGWTCEAMGGSEPGDIGTCTVDPDGNETCEINEPTGEPAIDESMCVPPYWSDIPGGGGQLPVDDNRENEPADLPGEGDEQPADGAEEPGVDEGSRLFGCTTSASGSGSPLAAALILFSLAYTFRRRALL